MVYVEPSVPEEFDTKQVGDWNSYACAAPPPQNGESESSWVLAMPSQTSPSGELTVSDVVSMDEYLIEKLSFDLQMVGSGGLDRLDEYAVFASVQPYNTYEFGIRMSVCDGVIKGYTIHTPPGQNYVIKEVDLLVNDGQMHHYEMEVRGNSVYFSVDGGPMRSISGHSFGGDLYGLTATAHRTTDGWASEGFYMVLENLKYGHSR